MNGNRFTLDELCALVDMPKRRVRFYIQSGLVDRPLGESRRKAYYTDKHLEQLLTVRKWQRAGLSLERIRELMSSQLEDVPPVKPKEPGEIEVWSHILLADGIELHIEPSRAGLTPEQVRKLFQHLRKAYEKIKEPKGGEHG